MFEESPQVCTCQSDGWTRDQMNRDSSKAEAKKPTTSAKLNAGPRVKHSKRKRPSAKERERIERGMRTLHELFAIGKETFKRLDTDTIVRMTEDKDLEYL